MQGDMQQWVVVFAPVIKILSFIAVYTSADSYTDTLPKT